MKKIFMLSFCLIFVMVLQAEDLKLIKFADSLFDSGDYYRAITEYKRYIFYNETGGFKKNATYRVALSYMMANKYDEAIENFEKIAVEYTGEMKYESLIGESIALMQKKDYVFSNGVASRLLNDPGAQAYMDKARYITGFNYLAQSDFKASVGEFEKITGVELGDEAASIKQLLNKSGEIPSRSPVISGILSLVIPGSGHMYCGRWTDGILSLLMNSFFVYNVYAAISRNDNVGKLTYGISGGVVYLSSVYGSIVSANKFNADEVQKFIRSADEYKVDVLRTEF